MSAVREPAEPYADAQAHLRDELWRVWLRVEYQVRARWEIGTLPRVADEASIGIWTPDNLAGLFRGAHADYTGQAAKSEADAGASKLFEAFLTHSRRVDARVEASLAAGVRLPLMELAVCFRLSRRQVAALTFALMPELDPNLLSAYRYLSHDPSCRGLDGRLLAMLVYDTPESRAQLSRDLSSRSPLVWYRLLEIEEHAASDSMLYRRVRPAGRLVQMLNGSLDELDPSLCDIAELRPADAAPPALFPEAVLKQAESAMAGTGVLLVLQGMRGTGKRLLVQTAAAKHGRPVLLIEPRALAALPPPVARPTVRALLREARLMEAVPLLPEVDDLVGQGESDELPGFVTTLCAEHPGPVAVTVCRERMPRLDARPAVHLSLEVPSLKERAELWQMQVPGLDEKGALELAERFATPGGTIAFAARAALAARAPGDGSPSVHALDVSVRNQLHDRILRLGRKLPTPHSFEDLIVDDDVADTLEEIIACVRQRRQVRERWGFRGAQGVSVLFSGDPGVGKTMSATVLARQLDLAIYEVDLSRVVSKWIGETEKNLSEVFDAAEPGHVVLLFNEADSLFGKRNVDVKTANDRYANLETNYLLQRLERFNGLAILTTNLAMAIDPAFRRRFAYDVKFSFPSAEMRAELWRRAIPARAMDAEIDFAELSERFALSGGFIKVAAERAAFLAAAQERTIGIELITATVERMYRERGKLAGIGQLE
jgi:hypothetical protein